jgi:hypothetical protein
MKVTVLMSEKLFIHVMVCYYAFSFLILHTKIEKSLLFILSTIMPAMTNLFIDSESFGGKNV